MVHHGNGEKNSKKLTLYVCQTMNILSSYTEPTTEFEDELRNGNAPTESLELLSVHLHAIGNACLDAPQILQMLRTEGTAAAS